MTAQELFNLTQKATGAHLATFARGRGAGFRIPSLTPVLLLVVTQATLAQPGAGSGPGDASLEALALKIATETDRSASAEAIHADLGKLEGLSRKALEGASSTAQTIERFNRFFFAEAGFDGEPDRGEPEGLLLHHVLARRRGTCVGLAQVYLILGERLGLPVRGAATPSHLFVRWVGGEAQINVELLEKGKEFPDEEYRTRHPFQEPDPARPVFLRDLSSLEVGARLLNNRGVIFSRAGRITQAEADYTRAVELDPRFPSAYYNRGLDRLNAGRHREALADFDAALALHPSDPSALNNRGLARLALGDRAGAEADFRRALELDAGLEAARQNLNRLAEQPD